MLSRTCRSSTYVEIITASFLFYNYPRGVCKLLGSFTHLCGSLASWRHASRASWHVLAARYSCASSLARFTRQDWHHDAAAVTTGQQPADPTVEIVIPTADDYAQESQASKPRSLRLWKPDAVLKAAPKLQRAAEAGERGRALNFGKRRGRSGPSVAQKAMAWLSVVIDSGCSWHVHYRREDLINLRSCNDTMTGVDGKARRVEGIGDLPALSRDNKGRLQRITIRNVRLISSFNDTLISVDQFWEDSKVDSQFRDRKYLELPATGSKPLLRLPFERRDRLYQWWILPIGSLPEAKATEAEARVLKTTVHRPKTAGHVAALPPNQLIELMQRRLHIGHEHLRMLGEKAADVPPNISKGVAPACPHGVEANAAPREPGVETQVPPPVEARCRAEGCSQTAASSRGGRERPSTELRQAPRPFRAIGGSEGDGMAFSSNRQRVLLACTLPARRFNQPQILQRYYDWRRRQGSSR